MFSRGCPAAMRAGASPFQKGDASPLSFFLQSAAKLNLTLRITGRRPDGYHDLRSLFFRLPGLESLTITFMYAHNVNDILEVQGEAVPGDNILIKVLALARQRTFVPSLRMKLVKNVPPGSGMGGGSGNAAALISFMDMFCNGRPAVNAEEAGSDVPFLAGGFRFAAVSGRGERVEPLPVPPHHLRTLVAVPAWTVSTSAAYAALDALFPERFPLSSEEAEEELRGVFSILAGNGDAGLLPNDFSEILLRQHPEYASLFALFQKAGACGWGITGSGSASFALFRDMDAVHKAAWALGDRKWIRKIILVE